MSTLEHDNREDDLYDLERQRKLDEEKDMSEKELIVLEQKPIIEFSAMEARGLEVAERIAEMNLSTIEASEANRSIMKKMRTELNKELGLFEDKRKMVHAAITKPYKDFTESYEENIKVRYTDASALLKDKISVVEDKMLEDKKTDVDVYFKDKKGDLDFLGLDSIGLNIILSVTNKKLHGQIDEFIERVANELASIEAMEDSIRISSLYKTNLDLSLSVSTVLADIKREKEAEEKQAAKEIADKKAAEEKAAKKILEEEKAAKDRVERKKREAEEAEQKRIIAKENAERNASKEAAAELERLGLEQKRAGEALELAEKEKARLAQEEADRVKEKEAIEKIHTMQFKVSGTIIQLKEIKLFMEEIGVTYE